MPRDVGHAAGRGAGRLRWHRPDAADQAAGAIHVPKRPLWRQFMPRRRACGARTAGATPASPGRVGVGHGGRGLGPGRLPSAANSVALVSPPGSPQCRASPAMVSFRCGKREVFRKRRAFRKKNGDPGQLPLTVAGGTLFCPLARHEARSGGPRLGEKGLKKAQGTGRENSFEILVRFRLTKIRRLPNLRLVRSATGRDRDGLVPWRASRGWISSGC